MKIVKSRSFVLPTEERILIEYYQNGRICAFRVMEV